MTVFPMIFVIRGVNEVSYTAVDLLLQNNAVAGEQFNAVAGGDCAYLKNAVLSWYFAYAAVPTNSRSKFDEDIKVLWTQVLPVRCPEFQSETGVLQPCELFKLEKLEVPEACKLLPQNVSDPSAQFYANELGIRVGGILDISDGQIINGTEYHVRALFNENNVVTST